MGDSRLETLREVLAGSKSDDPRCGYGVAATRNKNHPWWEQQGTQAVVSVSVRDGCAEQADTCFALVHAWFLCNAVETFFLRYSVHAVRAMNDHPHMRLEFWLDFSINPKEAKALTDAWCTEVANHLQAIVEAARVHDDIVLPACSVLWGRYRRVCARSSPNAPVDKE